LSRNVGNYQFKMRTISEEHSSHCHRGGNQKSSRGLPNLTESLEAISKNRLFEYRPSARLKEVPNMNWSRNQEET